MSIKKSIYEQLILESNDQSKTVDISGGTVAVEYYEDVFSPVITAKIKVVNVGNSVKNEQSGELQSIYNGLPLRGGERISLKIAGNSSTNPGLDFSSSPNDYLYVSSITDVISETNRESFTLNLVSREAITNETVRVPIKFKPSLKISESIKKIIKDYLKSDRVGIIDETSNRYGFIGNMRKPFTILIWLASKGVPVSSKDATAGFFFYQTKDGFQFRSIDSLVSQPKKATYIYSQATVNYDNDQNKINNDFRILNYITTKNQNLIEKLRLGTYASQRMFFNPLDFKFSDYLKGKFTLTDYKGKSSNLGDDVKLPLNLGEAPTRMITAILDIGTMDKGVSEEINSNPELYQSQSLMRYNVLFTQTLNVMIPSNTNLRAGDVIECLFPRISETSNNENDPDQSGLYMIKELCHHFDVENSYTSLKLIRDTYGLKENKQ
jgi:hypothetical protein